MLDLNEIHHGDCLELMRHIPDGSVDMILCDLPYGTTACHWDSVIPFDKLWAQYERVIKPNGAIVLTASFPFSGALWASNPSIFKYAIVWEKATGTGFLDSKFRPLKTHEDILVFSRGGCSNGSKMPMPYSPQMQAGEPYTIKRSGKITDSIARSAVNRTDTESDGGRYPRSVVKFPNQTGLHPTQKPVALFEYLIRTYTNPGEVVLDNCAGSFTTALAAENTGRQWICIEQEAKYCEIGRARLAALQPALALY